ncbi:MAG: PpiC-type peptidyl-prolyl cis-trans isomerase [Candidatus Solibacter sp.]|nr:PpiC-type peptidyl-prolyl cis-trans isomerase [Candidatus Solibacter sp.]
MRVLTFRVLFCLLLALAVFALGQELTSTAIPLRILVLNSAEEAARVRVELEKGADFAVLAREKSVDATSLDGGLLGKVDPATLREELRTAVRGLAPSQLSPVFRMPSGFAIVKVLAPGEFAGIAESQRARQAALRAESNIRFTTNLVGFTEAAAALANFAKPANWNTDLKQSCAMRQQSLADLKARAKKLAAAPDDPGHSPTDAVASRLGVAQVFAYSGEMDQAIVQLEMALRTASARAPKLLPEVEEMVGAAYLHRAGAVNGLYQRHPGEICIFPIRPELKYPKGEDSQKAAQHFLASLKLRRADIETKWLLNLAYMTLGKYPAGVPKEHLLAPSHFASAEDIGRFTDAAPRVGFDAILSQVGGLIVDDFDNDGLFDIVTSNWDFCAPMQFFHNNGDGTFTDRGAASGLSTQTGGANILQTDYNNDGCLDILVLRGGWETEQRKSLLRNNCNGTFTDVTVEAGLAEPTQTETAVWLDINNDGFIDLYVGNETGPNQLFLNNGNGTFKDISKASRTDLSALSKAVVTADYDHDGYADLFVSNFRGDSVLLHNNHDGTFTDVAPQAGVLASGHGFGAWFFDYDNDGWPDLMASSYAMSVEETMRTYLGMPHNSPTMKLYRNLGNGAFRDVTEETGLNKVFMPMGANFGDVDNDGYPDIRFGTGELSFASLLPNVLLHNKGGKTFVDISASSGTGELHKGHGVAFADMDNDGDEDLLEVVGGGVPGDLHAFRLFENPGHGNDWISVKLVGVKANRAAIGARIKVTVKNGTETRAVFRTVGSGGSFGASPLEQHLGLGKSAEIVGLEIQWPGDAQPQRFASVPKNRAIEIKQAATEYRVIERPRYQLGGKNGR